jgi:hypothetical protein
MNVGAVDHAARAVGAACAVGCSLRVVDYAAH